MGRTRCQLLTRLARSTSSWGTILAVVTRAAAAQGAPATDSVPHGFPTTDPVVQRIYDEGLQHSQAATLAQALMDSIGPRLTGSPANRAANQWLIHIYTQWGIPARNEQYGTWRDWTRGPSSVTLLAPRARVLEATQLPWSASTPASGIEADVVLLPRPDELHDSAGLAQWLTTTAKGKFLLVTPVQPSCRPDSSWRGWAAPSTYRAIRAARDSAEAQWRSSVALSGHDWRRAMMIEVAHAGVAGLLSNRWSGGWGVDKVMGSYATVPIFDVSCEDYTLLARLAGHNQHPRARAIAQSTLAPTESPVYNTVAELKGTERPDQYVILSAHLDSWDAGSGATDNGTGTIVMLEAMRLLKAAYPHPKRTILAGHWSGEEEGEIGSSAFAADHPDVLKGLQALLNQDNGTGNIDTVDTYGFLDAPAAFARWMARVPADLTTAITIDEPGFAHDEDSDSDPFACRDVPGFFLTSADWDYRGYTWHTNRDTYDKISFQDVARNATLIALLAYEASEDPEQLSRARRIPPTGAGGKEIAPPACPPTPRSWALSNRR
jgi:carboxypeptidase Q